MKKLTTEEFIEKARKVHGDKYDYSLVEYNGNRKKVKIICPVHGVFIQSSKGHLNGNGCPECKHEETGKRLRKTKEDFINESRKIHGDKYDYSLVEYKDASTKVKIICPVHGIFEQYPHDHLKCHGCIKCSGVYRRNTEDFITRSKKIHGSKYDYSLVEYKNADTKVKIICPFHGVFEQRSIDHLRGNGCQKCKEYSTEKDIERILKKENISNITQKTFIWLKDERCMTLDFYIPKYNVAIECQGIQHFKPIELFGGIQNYEYTVNHDQKKRELCEQHGIKVFYYANYKYKFPYKVYTNPEELINDIMKIDPV
jgi:hypothetical protein